MPTLLRIGMAESLAYRAEFVIWMLTSTLPLVMLALWTSVAAEAPFAQFESQHFVAYYLSTLVVRNLTGNWVIWQINDDIRRGTLSLKLLKPIHPFYTYAATHLASIPLRGLVALPFTVVLLLSGSGHLLIDDAARLGIFAASLVGAWALTFYLLTIIGSLAFFLEKSMSIFEIYLGVFSIFSGYLIPLSLLPDWLEQIATWLPFRYMLAFPVELLIGFHDTDQALRLLGVQWLFVGGTLIAALAVWRAGVRRFEAYGS
jgi:ABC-2 type transport system permease protein